MTVSFVEVNINIKKKNKKNITIVLLINILIACKIIIHVLNLKFLIIIIKQISMPFDYHDTIKAICAFGIRKKTSCYFVNTVKESDFRKSREAKRPK